MSIQDIALAFKSWAQENNLLGHELPVTIGVNGEVRDAAIDSLRISAASEMLLRQRQLLAVGFNESAEQVVIVTAKKLTVKDLKVMPQTFGANETPVVYVHGGSAQAGMPNHNGTPHPYRVTTKGAYCCGSSIHPATVLGAGTLGALVRDASGHLFGLSNNHVTGLCSYATDGDKVIAPGHVDINPRGIDPFTIGYHARALPMVPGAPDNIDIATNSDAALIKIADASNVSSFQGSFYDTPQAVTPLMPGMIVQKVGRTTGLTSGVVIAQIAGAHPVCYSVPGIGTPVAYFDPVFLIQAQNPSLGPFSINGDSGSLITTSVGSEKIAVGLVFAGDNQGNSYALSLEPILKALNVSLVTNHNI
jgi:hypothetical protein